MFKDGKGLKVLGIIATVLGIGASLASDWVSEKKQEAVIEKKVQKALSEATKEE